MDSLSAGFRRFPGVVLLGIAFAIAYGGTAVSAPRSEGPARTYDYDAPAASETPTTNLRIDTSEARTGARASSGAVRLVVGRFHEVSYSFDPGANSTDLRAQRRSRSHGYDSPAATTTPAANLRIAALLANRHPAGNSLPSPLSLARGRATKGGRAPASSAVSGRLLKRQLASESQMAGRGSPIFGSGTNRPLHEAPRLARTYGGRAQDYAKMGSSGTSRDGGGLYDLFETHWYQNLRTGQRFEPKTKFPRAEDFFRGGGGG